MADIKVAFKLAYPSTLRVVTIKGSDTYVVWACRRNVGQRSSYAPWLRCLPASTPPL